MAATERRPVTMADVGAAAGVSDRTVSNVLSGKVAVAPATRAAVLDAVRALGYQMNVSARALRTGRAGFITLAVPDLRIDYFHELAAGVMLEAQAAGWAVTLQLTGSDRDRETAILTGLDRQLSDGLIFQPHALGPRDRDLLITEQPLVLLGERIFDGPADHITMANTAAAQVATEHLLDSGRRRIAAIGPNFDDHSETAATLRLSGYRRALEGAGLPYRAELVVEAKQWHQADGAAAVRHLVEGGACFDAVFCFNDTLAFGAMHALAELGLSVPTQVAVVGFDNVTAAAYTNPPLTTIDPGGAQIAQRAVQLLAARAGAAAASSPLHVVADFHLVKRRSS